MQELSKIVMSDCNKVIVGVRGEMQGMGALIEAVKE